MRKGRAAEAEEILSGMQGGDSALDYIDDKINLADALLSRGEPEGARALLLPLIAVQPKKYHDLLQVLLRTNDQRIGLAETSETRLAIEQESLSWLGEQQRLRPSSFTIYRIAKMQLAMGDRSSALMSFRTALEKAPSDSHYRDAAASFVEQLEGL
jgi:tetratricopeptide (TPR) repeat protein